LLHPHLHVLVGFMTDYTIEDCVWQDFAFRSFHFQGRSLTMRRCKFLNCGSEEFDGSCVTQLVFMPLHSIRDSLLKNASVWGSEDDLVHFIFLIQ
jgi:hypothetical protein